MTWHGIVSRTLAGAVLAALLGASVAPLRADDDKDDYRLVAGEERVTPDKQSKTAVAPAVDLRVAKEIKPAAKLIPASLSVKSTPDAVLPKPADSAAKPAAEQPHEPAAAAADSLDGNPLAPGMLQILRDEIQSALRTRGISDNFSRFQHYAGYKLDSTASAYTGSELTGNCRLSWYDHLLRHPLDAPTEAEEFTRTLHHVIRTEPGGLPGCCRSSPRSSTCRGGSRARA